MKHIFICSFLILTIYITTPSYGQNQADSIPAWQKHQLDHALILAADSGNIERVNALLNLGADPEATTPSGISALMYASQNGHLAVVEGLLGRGANPNAVPPNGSSALHAAVQSNHADVVELLIAHGAEVNKYNNQGVVPLHIASAYGFPYLVELLIYHGADVMARDRQGNTPLHASVYAGAQVSTRILLSHWANVDDSDDYGFTPLMVAAQFNDTTLTRLLLENGANAELKNLNGANALTIAIEYAAEETANILIDIALANNAVSEKALQAIALHANEVGLHQLTTLINGRIAPPEKRFGVSAVMFDLITSFSSRELLLGLGIGFQETRTGLSLNFGFGARPSAGIALIDMGNHYLQLREHLRLYQVGVGKLYTVMNLRKGARIGVGWNIAALYARRQFPDYRGIDYPTSTYRVVPGLQVAYSRRAFRIVCSAEYFAAGWHGRRANLISLKWQYRLYSSTPRPRYKDINWIQ